MFCEYVTIQWHIILSDVNVVSHDLIGFDSLIRKAHTSLFQLIHYGPLMSVKRICHNYE